MDGRRNISRAVVARLAEAVYVLHAFQKKTQTTAQPDLQLARQRAKYTRHTPRRG